MSCVLSCCYIWLKRMKKVFLETFFSFSQSLLLNFLLLYEIKSWVSMLPPFCEIASLFANSRTRSLFYEMTSRLAKWRSMPPLYEKAWGWWARQGLRLLTFSFVPCISFTQIAKDIFYQSWFTMSQDTGVLVKIKDHLKFMWQKDCSYSLRNVFFFNFSFWFLIAEVKFASSHRSKSIAPAGNQKCF